MEKYISGSGRFITVLEFFVKQLVGPIPDEAPRRTREKTSATQGRLGHYYQDFVVRKAFTFQSGSPLCVVFNLLEVVISITQVFLL